MSNNNGFDNILTHLGTGPWNMLYFIGSSYATLMLPPQFISGVYLAPDINYTCLPPEGNQSIVTISEDSCSYIKITESGEVKEECTEWDFDTSVFSNTLTSEFLLICDRKHYRAVYQSIYMLGTFLSPVLGGYIADRFGRKLVVVVTQVLSLVFSCALMFFTNFIAILVLRFFLGTFCLLTFFVLAMEVCEPKHRGTVGILIGLPWALGTIAWGGMAFLIRDWRWLQLSVSLPLALLIPVLYLMDESPRWLIVRGHHDQAMQVLRKAARWNKTTLQPESELRALMRDIQEESVTHQTSNTNLKTSNRFHIPLLSTRPIMIITAVVCVNYFAVSFMFDGLNMSGDIYSADPFLYIVLNGLVEVPGYSITAPIIDRWGRKMPTILSYVLSGIIITVIIFIPTDLTALIMTLALAGKVCISGAYQIIYVYSSELFPTEVRSQGIGIASMCAQLASMIVPYVTTFLGPLLPWLPSLIFGVASILAGVLTVALKETNNTCLPDTIADLSSTTNTTTIVPLKEEMNVMLTGSSPNQRHS